MVELLGRRQNGLHERGDKGGEGLHGVLTCLEMAREVRALHSEAQKPTAPAARPAPPRHAQPKP